MICKYIRVYANTSMGTFQELIRAWMRWRIDRLQTLARSTESRCGKQDSRSKRPWVLKILLTTHWPSSPLEKKVSALHTQQNTWENRGHPRDQIRPSAARITVPGLVSISVRMPNSGFQLLDPRQSHTYLKLSAEFEKVRHSISSCSRINSGRVIVS